MNDHSLNVINMIILIQINNDNDTNIQVILQKNQQKRTTTVDTLRLIPNNRYKYFNHSLKRRSSQIHV